MSYKIDLIGRILGVPMEMLEMAAVFHMPASARFRYLILPAIFGRKRS